MKAAVLPVALYGSCLRRYSKGDLQCLRAAVKKAVFGIKCALAAPEIVVAAALPRGLDPLLAIAAGRCSLVRAVWHLDADCRED